ncbi:amino acid aminotransferase [Pseudomonas sp. dw_358]|uniref:amino acid aminotransferase n=1 Tax=Pseudomonas sp. dw_358 TaxID=2720083 RepID=UPI001BD6DBE4|nr:amino acid aminotransferase [Pseudomonas sp. dw_358]
MFEHLEPVPGDPILDLLQAFIADPRPQKVNLSVGIYYDEHGQVPLLESVAQAQHSVLEAAPSRSYLPMEGDAEYRRCVGQLVFADSVDTQTFSVVTVQTVGGSGALKVGADFLQGAYPQATVWVSDPTWDNHYGIFEGAGFSVRRYPYYAAATQGFDYPAALAAFEALPASSIVVLHPCCHNPTGVQPSQAQWHGLLDALQTRNAVVFMDMAYQGLGLGLDEDAWLVRECARRGLEFLLANSFSKTFSLYAERVGALSVVVRKEQATTLMGQLKRAVRRNYSSPPLFGSLLVKSVLGDPARAALWRTELAAMRGRIIDLRRGLFEGLTTRMPQRDFSNLLHQQGMFGYTGLSPEQVDALREQHGIYALRTGRICIAGLTAENTERVCDAWAAVVAPT